MARYYSLYSKAHYTSPDENYSADIIDIEFNDKRKGGYGVGADIVEFAYGGKYRNSPYQAREKIVIPAGQICMSIANTGDRIISYEKTLNGGYVRVTRRNGEVALSKTYRDTMIVSAEISDDGRLCCYETDISPRETADQRLFIFDVETGKKITSFRVADTFGHGAFPDIVRLTHDEVFFDIGGHVFGVSFKGEIVDIEAWNEYRLSKALGDDHGYSAYYLSFEMEPARALELLKVSISKKLESKFPAKVYRRIGEVYEELGDPAAAISNYEAALSIDPKVGIKKRLAALKKD